MFFIWPAVQSGIYSVGNLVLNSGTCRNLGVWIYGKIIDSIWSSSCILSSVLADRCWWNNGSWRTANRRCSELFFAQLADPTVTEFSVSATRFMSGKFPLMIFGLAGRGRLQCTRLQIQRRKRQ